MNKYWLKQKFKSSFKFSSKQNFELKNKIFVIGQFFYNYTFREKSPNVWVNGDMSWALKKILNNFLGKKNKNGQSMNKGMNCLQGMENILIWLGYGWGAMTGNNIVNLDCGQKIRFLTPQ